MKIPRIPLGDLILCKAQYGANAPAVKRTSRDERPRYVRITDITSDGELDPSCAVAADLEDDASYRLEEGDLILARSGNTVGKSYLYNPTDGECIFAGYLIRFRLNKSRVLPRLVYYYTQSGDYRRWLDSKRRVAGQPNINGSEFSSLPIPVPNSREDQQRLTVILDEADFLRRSRREADEISQELLVRSFSKVLDEPRAVVGAKRLDAVADVTGGGTPSKAKSGYWVGGMPWVSPKDVKTPRLHDTEDHISEAAVRESATTVVPKHSPILVVRSGILAHTVPVAITNRPMAINQDIKALLPRPGILPYYLFGFLRARRENLLSCVKRGATVHNFDMASFKSFPIPIVTDRVQQRLAELTEEWVTNSERQQITASTLDNLFQALLERAFDGRLSASHREGLAKETVQEMAIQKKKH